MFDVTVIGPAVIDILASPVDLDAIASGVRELDRIRMSFGGDALNEAVVLSRLGKKVQLISKVGDDEAGRRILTWLEGNGIATDSVIVQAGLDTAINIVLIEKNGNRRFLMNPHSSLYRLSREDVLPFLDGMAEIVSFASMFISPLFTIPKMEQLFAQIKKSGRRLTVDVARAKNGETIEDVRPLLSYMDVFFPNEEEIAALTGEKDPVRNVCALVEAGTGTAVVKTGPEGCLIGCREPGSTVAGKRPGQAAGKEPDSAAGREPGAAVPETEAGCHGIQIMRIPAVSGVRCVDSTGAGDSFAAGFISGMCDGLDSRECARLGCAAASCSIEEIGATDGVLDLTQVMERYGRTSSAVRLS